MARDPTAGLVSDGTLLARVPSVKGQIPLGKELRPENGDGLLSVKICAKSCSHA